MKKQPDENNLLLKIDLRNARAASQRKDDLDSYTLRASQLSMDIRDIVKSNKSVNNIDISIYASEDNEDAGRKDAAQIIDAITIAIASIGGFSGLSVLILNVIAAARNKIPTTYEVEVPGVGKMKLIRQKGSKDDMAILESMMSDLKNKHGHKIISSDNESVIIIRPRNEE